MLSRKNRKGITAKCNKPLCVLCVHLTLRSLREKKFFTQSPQRENHAKHAMELPQSVTNLSAFSAWFSLRVLCEKQHTPRKGFTAKCNKPLCILCVILPLRSLREKNPPRKGTTWSFTASAVSLTPYLHLWFARPFYSLRSFSFVVVLLRRMKEWY
jgi:hypothetical protein